jgi:predicted metal-dependent hydrolase
VGDEAAKLLCVSGPVSGFTQSIRHFLREEARRDLSEAATRYARQVRRSVRSITLRDTKSRWGSCTARGALNFSWRLIFAPPLVLDYLAAHEVAHLVHMNHSEAFWSLTHKLAPHSDEAECWLKAHGASLHYYDDGAVTPLLPSG